MKHLTIILALCGALSACSFEPDPNDGRPDAGFAAPDAGPDDGWSADAAGDSDAFDPSMCGVAGEACCAVPGLPLCSSADLACSTDGVCE